MRKINIATFGSCMSEAVAAQIINKFGAKNFYYANHVIHNRSDYFYETHIAKTNLEPDIDELTSISDVKTLKEFGDLDLISENIKYLKNQKKETIGCNNDQSRANFLNNIEHRNIDILICDNYMDIASMLLRRSANSSFFALTGAFSREIFDKHFTYDHFLTPENSHIHWVKIFQYLSDLMPQTEFYFIVYPPSIAGQEHRPPVVRSKLHHDHWLSLKKPISLAHTIYAERVASEYVLDESDWAHYLSDYYKNIAFEIINNSSYLRTEGVLK